uniref:NADH-ubiquinone oxidoreductase chain 6 n=1 Tax=Ornithoptera richmondia TaxID=2064775 RepID=A0A2U3PPL6_9NEOP|nr:NADH dehydrogenase subunit 6 [Ornithoptera richmondia]SPP23508.1 NADH dehydrogenase subunit 6 [Ornithoptera richmondia]
MKMFISLFMILLSFIMYFLNHPISMGLSILTQTLLTCLILGMINYTYWFSYILFLVFMGGLLVLFIYVSSIASNELFNFNILFKNSIILSLMLIFFFSFLYKLNLNWLNFYFNNEMNNFFNWFIFFNNENKINISKLYNNQIFFLMIMMIIYLFIVLIAVVKITNIFYGPLRSFKY